MPSGTGRTGPPVRRLWAAVLCGYLGFGASLQALPAYVVTRFGAGAAGAGLAVGVAFAATAVCRPLAGRAGDAGRSRPVVVTGGALIAAGGAAHLVAPNLTVLLAARLVMGAGEAALFSAALPWVLAETPARRRGRVAGWFGLSMWGGLAAGPLLAVAVAHLVGPIAVWAAVLGLGMLSAGMAVTTAAQPAPANRPGVLPRSLRDILPPGAALPGLGFGLAAYGYGTIAALLVLHLTSSGVGGQDVGLAVFAVAFLSTRWLASPVVDRFGGATIAVTVLGVESLGLVLIAAAPTQPGALVGVTLAGVGVSLMFPASVAITLARGGELKPGASVGIVTSFWDLGILAAGGLGGLIATTAGYPAAFLVAAGASAAALTLAAILRQPITSRGRVPGAVTPSPTPPEPPVNDRLDRHPG